LYRSGVTRAARLGDKASLHADADGRAGSAPLDWSAEILGI